MLTVLIVAANVTFGVGMALVMTPLMTVSLLMDLYGHGSAIMNALQQLGGAMGTAVLIAAMSVGAARADAPLVDAQAAGTSEAFLAGGILALIAVIAAPFVGPLPTTKVVSSQTPR